MNKLKKFLKILGPGVITGAADDDPSGIATYTQTGARFGFGQLWIAFFSLPLMISIQELCARIGAITGHGIVSVIKNQYSKKLAFFVVLLLILANTINIGADIGAMAGAVQLIFPINFPILMLFFTALILVMEIFVSYKTYKKILKWFALSLLAYPITLLLIDADWLKILKATFIPHFEFSFGFLFVITGVIGTTISPYMFFWQSAEEVEEEKMKKMIFHGQAHITKSFIKKLRLDNFFGMLFSNLTTWSIIVVSATVLNGNGVFNVSTPAQAAMALEPLVNSFPNAGMLAKIIFATGVIGLGMLAIPVLSASASYAVSELFNWKEGLNLKFKKAHGFYGVITIATIIGLIINFVGIDPIQALIFAAVFNGVAAVPLIYIIAKIGQNKKIMGEYESGTWSKIGVWTTFLLMLFSAVAMFWTIFK